MFFQVRPNPDSDRPRVTVFADYHALDLMSLKNALAIKALADQLPCYGRIDLVRVDPAATARSGVGPAAYIEYERVFGTRSSPTGRATGSWTGSTPSSCCSRPAT